VSQLRDKLAADGMDFATFRKDIRGQIVRARLREAEVDSRIQISEADVDAFLESSDKTQGSAVELNIAQVFMKLPEEPDAQTLTEVTARMEQARERALAGEDFAALARSLSQAPEAGQGGSLGWRTADRLPGLFVEGLRGLEPGGLSKVIRSAAGLHLLKLVEQRGGAADVADGKPLTQTRVRHILMRVDSERGQAEAERTLQLVRERLQSKQVTFEAMARQYSADGSASRGGELGWLYPGDTVPEFERAMNALEPGQVSEPVRSPFGLHLIQVVERRQSGNADDRKRQLTRQKLREKRSDEAYREWLVQLRDRTYVEYRLEE
jgi:peptidyl-prolyl cis-trans isomerase SurA